MKWQSSPPMSNSPFFQVLKTCFISMVRLYVGRGRHLCNWLKAAGVGGTSIGTQCCSYSDPCQEEHIAQKQPKKTVLKIPQCYIC